MLPHQELRLECIERAIRINPIVTVYPSPQGGLYHPAPSSRQEGPSAEKILADAAKFLAFVDPGAAPERPVTARRKKPSRKRR